MGAFRQRKAPLFFNSYRLFLPVQLRLSCRETFENIAGMLSCQFLTAYKAEVGQAEKIGP